MKTTWVIREMQPRTPFRISRVRRHPVRNVFVRLEAEGIAGFGEASPSGYYLETAEGVAERIDAARGFLETLRVRSVADLERAWEESWKVLAPSRAAQCAVDLALWDWLAKREGISCAELAWGEPPRDITTFCTIGLSTAAELAGKVEELRGFPRIKIKSDAEASLEPFRYVRERSPALLAVDANCAWRSTELVTLSQELAQLGVSFIEQPLPPERDAELLHCPGLPPILADESCVTRDDVERAARYFAGFNIKLVKCGGITPARQMVARGREFGLTIMVGCMLESSVLIAAGVVIAQRTDYADLDGAWLLGNDPFSGWNLTRGILQAPAKPGLGTEPRDQDFWLADQGSTGTKG